MKVSVEQSKRIAIVFLCGIGAILVSSLVALVVFTRSEYAETVVDAIERDHTKRVLANMDELLYVDLFPVTYEHEMYIVFYTHAEQNGICCCILEAPRDGKYQTVGYSGTLPVPTSTRSHYKLGTAILQTENSAISVIWGVKAKNLKMTCEEESEITLVSFEDYDIWWRAVEDYPEQIYLDEVEFETEQYE